ncbi:DNA polymerase I [Allopseudospirillum japonicum]|uniref:DNA polymerase I n=1 Tax=Allopseudospirillum japonicum TaxID=64971 RepID=A0A1H6TQK8_9GAMM|nr:DNA polymerase I [Allopseudospirillum japonicum]SEI82318.1 DNA polymerase I [Allopseudospirillum japonicum]
MPTPPTVILVDASSYLYRAFSVLPPLIDSQGRPTGAMLGTLKMLKRLQKTYPQVPIITVFDAKGENFRHKLYKEYKANRTSADPDLILQIKPLHACIRALGLPLISQEGVEADDVIGVLAYQASQAGHQVLIISGDKDLCQLINEKVHMRTMDQRDHYFDPEGVKEKYGISPEYIVDYLAIKGDTSDNVPGVKGIGEKGALALIQHFGHLQDIYAHLDQVAEIPVRGAKSLAKKLQEDQESAYLSLELVRIYHEYENINLDIDWQNLKMAQMDVEQVRQLYQDFEFNSLLKELEEEQLGTQDTKAIYQCIQELSDWHRYLEEIASAPAFVIDLETTSLDSKNAEIVGIALSTKQNEGVYIPLAHLEEKPQLACQQVLQDLRPYLESTEKVKIGQHLKYDIDVLENYGIRVEGPIEDTQLESYILNSTLTKHNMDDLAATYLQRKTIRFEEIAGKGKKQLNFAQIPIEIAFPYAAEDAEITWALHAYLYPLLKEQPQLLEVYRTIELPLIPILASMQRKGVALDVQALQDQSQELAVRIQALEQKAYQLAGQEFNLSSPKQLGHILYEVLQVPVIKRTPKGQPSTAEDILEQLSQEYPLPRLLLEHRSLTKLKNTYTEKLPKLLDKNTGRLHTHYHQAVTATGRLSSSDPNLQNIPIRTAEGRRIRQAFIAREGYCLVAADYSQIELRIMAHLSEDPGLLAAFNQQKDVHTATAAEVFALPVDQVTTEQRRSAKAINFGLLYGMSAFGLARQLKIEREQAQTYIDTYFARYPQVAAYMQKIRAQAHEQGYVETLFGRRLYVPEIRQPSKRQAAERTAINAPMQGTAADLIKKAMIRVDAWLQAHPHLDAWMLMQVHDELVFEVREQDTKAVIEGIRTCMQGVATLKVPLIVDVGVGANWDQAH